MACISSGAGASRGPIYFTVCQIFQSWALELHTHSFWSLTKSFRKDLQNKILVLWPNLTKLFSGIVNAILSFPNSYRIVSKCDPILMDSLGPINLLVDRVLLLVVRKWTFQQHRSLFKEELISLHRIFFRSWIIFQV